MSAGWVAGGVRAKGLARHRLGPTGVSQLAAAPGLAAAIAVLLDTPYAHEVRTGQDLGAAQRAVASTFLWNLRVLAGWAPYDGVRMLRLVAGWFEIANVEDRLTAADAGSPPTAYELGSLSIAWKQLAGANGPADVRARLAASWWRDPGQDSPRAIGLAMRARLLVRAAAELPGARAWALGAAALMLARERLLAERPLPAEVSRTLQRLLAADATGSVAGFAERLPAAASWVIDGLADPSDLWAAETRWWDRVERDGLALLRRPPRDAAPAVGAIAVLAADAWRTRGALEVAARGGRSEHLDALA